MSRLAWVATLAGCTLPVAPRPACGAYVDCVRALDASEGVATDVERYLPEGACWGGDELADLCERSCENGLTWLRTHAADLPAACR